MKKKRIIIISILIVILTSIILTSIYFIVEVNKDKVEVKDNEVEYKTTLKEAPLNSNIEEENILDIIAYTLYNAKKCDEFKVVTKGESKASFFTQKIANERIKKKNELMISTISSGFISVGTQRYYNLLENKALERKAKKIDDVTPSWDDASPSIYTISEMNERYGWSPFEANGYIISKDTILNMDNLKLIKNDDNTYSIKLDLNPNDKYAPFWYKREIIMFSNSTMVPIFHYIRINFVIDKNYKLLRQEIEESYTVKSYGFKMATDTSVVDTFLYDNIEFDKDSLDYFKKY